VIVLAVCGLTVSLATRVFRLSLVHHTTTVQSGAARAVRQHLNKDAAMWRPPVTKVVFEVVSFYPRVSPAGPPIPSLIFDESLYNRPPPSC